MRIGQARRRILDRRDDPAVRVASADVSGQGLPNLRLVRARVSVEEGLGAHQKPGRAEAALAAVVVQEGPLYGVKFSAVREAFDGKHPPRSDLQGEHLAGVDREPVEKDRAGATLAAVAASLRTGQVESFAENPQERPVVPDLHPTPLAVHVEGYSVQLRVCTHFSSRTLGYGGRTP